jgi:hypothetical protein
MKSDPVMEIAVGLCQCGCGRQTSISDANRPAHGHVKGQPHRYCRGHAPHKKLAPPQPDPNRSGLCECGCGQQTALATATAESRGNVRGLPQRFVYGHRNRKPTVRRYRMTSIKGKKKRNHVIRAERALGKPLPPHAVVHHADGSRDENAPLVICQDRMYHALLHLRMRIKAAGGNPNTDSLCGRCKQTKPKEDFCRSQRLLDDRSSLCKDCSNEYRRNLKPATSERSNSTASEIGL